MCIEIYLSRYSGYRASSRSDFRPKRSSIDEHISRSRALRGAI